MSSSSFLFSLKYNFNNGNNYIIFQTNFIAEFLNIFFSFFFFTQSFYSTFCTEERSLHEVTSKLSWTFLELTSFIYLYDQGNMTRFLKKQLVKSAYEVKSSDFIFLNKIELCHVNNHSPRNEMYVVRTFRDNGVQSGSFDMV